MMCLLGGCGFLKRNPVLVVIVHTFFSVLTSLFPWYWPLNYVPLSPSIYKFVILINIVKTSSLHHYLLYIQRESVNNGVLK